MMRTLFLILAQCLLIYSWVWALALEIPSQYGTIKEAYTARAAEQNKGRTIIHIQDAHCNYEAQKNLAQILEYLVKKYNLKTIMVEGGSGNVSLSFLRGYSDRKAREEIADKYLKEAKISGEEYLDIVSDYNLELYGIEDEGLYDAHLASFEKIDSFREAGLKDVESLSRAIEALKPYIYSEPLMQLEGQKKSYESAATSLAQYCQYLKEAADKKGLSLKDYPHLAAFVETARLEKELDFKQAEAQRNTFIKNLAGLLDEKAVKELIQKTEDFKSKKLSSQEYYSLLKTLAQGRLDLPNNYPYLNYYIQYLTVSKEIDAPSLLKEVKTLGERIKEAFFTTPEQRKLSELAKSSGLLKRLLDLEFTPEDYSYFKENPSQFLTASWVDFLTENCQKHNLTLQPSASKIIDDNLEQLGGFYQLGIYREKAFIKNMEDKIGNSDEKIVVLITGGFHTPGITSALKEEGYSYAVVAPALTKKSNSDLYFSVLRGEKSHLEEALNIGE